MRSSPEVVEYKTVINNNTKVVLTFLDDVLLSLEEYHGKHFPYTFLKFDATGIHTITNYIEKDKLQVWETPE